MCTSHTVDATYLIVIITCNYVPSQVRSIVACSEESPFLSLFVVWVGGHIHVSHTVRRVNLKERWVKR